MINLVNVLKPNVSEIFLVSIIRADTLLIYIPDCHIDATSYWRTMWQESAVNFALTLQKQSIATSLNLLFLIVNYLVFSLSMLFPSFVFLGFVRFICIGVS